MITRCLSCSASERREKYRSHAKAIVEVRLCSSKTHHADKYSPFYYTRRYKRLALSGQAMECRRSTKSEKICQSFCYIYLNQSVITLSINLWRLEADRRESGGFPFLLVHCRICPFLTSFSLYFLYKACAFQSRIQIALSVHLRTKEIYFSSDVQCNHFQRVLELSASSPIIHAFDLSIDIMIADSFIASHSKYSSGYCGAPMYIPWFSWSINIFVAKIGHVMFQIVHHRCHLTEMSVRQLSDLCFC